MGYAVPLRGFDVHREREGDAHLSLSESKELNSNSETLSLLLDSAVRSAAILPAVQTVVNE